jgi:hypothetical protein
VEMKKCRVAHRKDRGDMVEQGTESMALLLS